MSKPMRCRLHLHRWRVASTEDGSYRFRRCGACGAEQPFKERPLVGPWF